MKRILVDIAAILVVFGLGFGIGQYMARTPTMPVGTAVEVEPSKVLADVPTERLDCKPVIVYKERAKAKTALPDQIRADPAKSVIAATDVRPQINPVTITSVIDANTGQVTSYQTKMALPWLALDTRGEAGAAIGWDGRDKYLRVEARQALADIKSWKVGGFANYDLPLGSGERRWMAGGGAWYRW